MTETRRPVIFAGAGPGDPDLITLKAKKALERADLVIYAGSLVPEAVLCWTKKEASAISSAGMTLEDTSRAIREAYEKGEAVVRLHTGDPSFYGAIFEQMILLDKQSIPYEVIPGVTAAFAASAAMKMEYTLPEVTQTLILTRITGRTPVPEKENLDSLAAHQASMAIYLSLSHIDSVEAIIQKHYGTDALCAVAYKVSHPEETLLYAKASSLAQTCREHNIKRHALIVVGRAVETCRSRKDIIQSKLYDAGFSHGYRSARK